MRRTQLAAMLLAVGVMLGIFLTVVLDSVARQSHQQASAITGVAEPFTQVAPGTTETFSLVSAELNRTFLLSRPATPVPAAGYPVIFMFHGWQETAAQMRDYSQMDHADALVVYADGIARAWAGGPYSKTNQNGGDEVLVRDILARLSATYPIDGQRVFAVGLSNGGGFTALLSCRAPDIIHAVAEVSAANYSAVRRNCSPTPVPTLSIHGTNDGVMHFDGGTRHGSPYDAVPAARRFDSNRNGCTGENIIPQGPAIDYYQQQGCQVPTDFYTIKGGVHIWDGAPADANASVPKGFATDKVLEFFGVGRQPEQPVEPPPLAPPEPAPQPEEPVPPELPESP